MIKMLTLQDCFAVYRILPFTDCSQTMQVIPRSEEENQQKVCTLTLSMSSVLGFKSLVHAFI